MDFTHLVRTPGIIEYPLSNRGLPRVNMGYYAYIPYFCQTLFVHNIMALQANSQS